MALWRYGYSYPSYGYGYPSYGYGYGYPSYGYGYGYSHSATATAPGNGRFPGFP